MARTPLMQNLVRTFRVARFAEAARCSVAEARERLAERRYTLDRRRFLMGVGAVAVAGRATQVARAGNGNGNGNPPGSTRIAIVGGGLAGLACADALAAKGYAARIYEAHPNRLGGRCYTDRTTFPGQASENGGELIDNLHKTMLRFANELGLAREDLDKNPGDPTYFFGGQHYLEDEVVDEYRILEARMRPDLQACSGSPTFQDHTPSDIGLDLTDLATYLDARGGDLPLVRSVLSQAYIAEYGLEPWEQSSLNMLLFLHLDRRRTFAEFGVFSDERFHLVGGNDAVVAGLAARIPGPIEHGARLTRLAKNAFGEYELYFNGGTVPEKADAVVLAVPFSTLRLVDLDPSLGLSTDKRRAITELGYGTNCKTAVGFVRRTWSEQGRNGLIYADLPSLQNTWETSWTTAGETAILTDYAGGDRGREIQLNPQGTTSCGGCHSGAPTNRVIHAAGQAWLDGEVEAFVSDLDQVLPGAAGDVWRGGDGRIVYQRAHWLPQPYSRGSYTAYKPGQFTTVAGLEGEAAGALKFAGEHADSFYDWQGFMEGACNSGIAAAEDILDDIKHGRIPS